jgi:glycosyltransferase involved in cell wall biosynthesis
MSFYVDLSEFLANPIRTGIQRIAGEMCRYLPDGRAIPVRLSARGLVALEPALIRAIGSHFGDASDASLSEIRRLTAIEDRTSVTIGDSDVLFVPEVFDNRRRIAAYQEMGEKQLERCRFLVYDLLPLTHPEYFSAQGLPAIYSYYRLLRDMPHCAFISDYTRQVYYERFKQTAATGGAVLQLGSDSLGSKRPNATLNRPLTFSVLGTLEPRKNHELILDAFEPLLAKVPGLTLNFIGKMGWVNSDFAGRVRALSDDPDSGFHFFSAPDDYSIRKHIENSRATIYVSSAEGFGLPPVESLWLFTPVIASQNIPSLERLGGRGIHYIDSLDVVSLRRGIVALLTDEYANEKIREIENLSLPTWQSFTEEMMHWCEQ